MTPIAENVRDLFEDQLENWELARTNYGNLDKVRVREIEFPGFRIFVQFNPHRITSSSAKVDTRSIQERPCFLCERNRPPEQKGIDFQGGYKILINPFPIFNRHLTIVSDDHTDQRILGNMESMLDLASALPDYVLFYNGPQCGASAPDHLHFQAGNKGFMPVEDDFRNKKLVRMADSKHGTALWLWQDYGRSLFTLVGDSKATLISAFERFYARFAELQKDKPEPMLNILASYETGEWRIHLFPRSFHRPECYFAEGAEKILLSPASVDMGGVLITPREEDFLKIRASDICAIFNQVCLDETEITELTKNIL